MARFLHLADLHLSEGEYDYSAAVLKEIVGAAAALGVDAILVAGHLTAELEAFADILGRSTCEWLWVAGAGERPASCANVRVLDQRPFDLVTRAGVEILALPHRSSFADYRTWQVPDRTARRIALVHAPVVTLPSLATDAPGGAIDPDLFHHWQVDYAALGSAHETRAPSTFGEILMADPGSARLTDTETGIRGGYLVEIDEHECQPRWVTFASAGQRRQLTVPVTVDGELPELDTSAWTGDDLVVLQLCGALWKVDPAAVERRARDAWGPRVRRLEVDGRRLAVASDAKLAAIARRLDDLSGNEALALRAREQGLSLLVTAG